MSEKMIDAWIAVHPVEGISIVTASRSRSFCEDKLLKSYFNFDYVSSVFAKADAYYAARDIELIRAENDNWAIRRCEITLKEQAND